MKKNEADRVKAPQECGVLSIYLPTPADGGAPRIYIYIYIYVAGTFW